MEEEFKASELAAMEAERQKALQQRAVQPVQQPTQEPSESPKETPKQEPVVEKPAKKQIIPDPPKSNPNKKQIIPDPPAAKPKEEAVPEEDPLEEKDCYYRPNMTGKEFFEIQVDKSTFLREEFEIKRPSNIENLKALCELCAIKEEGFCCPEHCCDVSV